MFFLITGNPGSGKSAFLVDYILENKDNYSSIYTNINGLKLVDNIKILNFPKFYEIMKECKNIYDKQINTIGLTNDNNLIDKPIIDYLLSIDFISLNADYNLYTDALQKRKDLPFFNRLYLNVFKPLNKQSKYKPSLFLFDEAHNQFPAINEKGKSADADPVLIWTVSYHRHLYFDAILATQEYTKINVAYRKDMEYFYDGVISSKRILGKYAPNFKYKKHMSTPYFKTNHAGNKLVTKRKEIFDMYDSGDEVRAKSIIMPLIFISLFMLVLVIGIFYYALSGFMSDENEDIHELPKTVTKIVKSQKTITEDDISFTDLKYLKFNCIQNTCTNKVKSIDFQVDDLENLLKNTDSKYLRSVKRSSFFSELYLLVSPTFLGLFTNKGANNEQSKGFTLIN